MHLRMSLGQRLLQRQRLPLEAHLRMPMAQRLRLPLAQRLRLPLAQRLRLQSWRRTLLLLRHRHLAVQRRPLQRPSCSCIRTLLVHQRLPLELHLHRPLGHRLCLEE